MRIVAGHAALAQRLVLEDKRAALGSMAFETGVILAKNVGGASAFND